MLFCNKYYEFALFSADEYVDFKFDQYFLKPEQKLERSQFTSSFPGQKDQSLDFVYSVWANKATNQLHNDYLTLKQNIRHTVFSV